MKTTTKGRLHVHSKLAEALNHLIGNDHEVSPEAGGQASALLQQDEADEHEQFPLEIVGHPDEDIPRGYVLLSIGPISLEVHLGNLQRALRPFEWKR